MTTSQTAFLSEILGLTEVIPAGKKAYFQERFRNRLFEFLVTEFEKRRADDPEFTQAALAKRLEKRPEQINRWLSAPSNLTADTLSDLLLGIRAAEPEIGATVLSEKVPQNYREPDWLTSPPIGYAQVDNSARSIENIVPVAPLSISVGARK
jgi:hypothetical protein